MGTVKEHDFGTYPRRFNTYRWYKPLLVAALFLVFKILFDSVINSLSEQLFSLTATSLDYDTVDFYTVPGVFSYGLRAADVIPCLILAALIVKDRPLSSYFSSMGGWRWKVFFKTFAAGLIVIGIPRVTMFLLHGKTGDVRFTAGGFFLMLALIPFQCIAEEIQFRGFVMQTFGSWFNLTVVGLIAQTVLFAAIHPYNVIGVISIAVAGLIYASACLFSKGIESSSAMHTINNISGIIMAGFGFGSISSGATVKGAIVNRIPEILFFLFILFADRKLHWFDDVKKDDVEQFNSRRSAKNDQ